MTTTDVRPPRPTSLPAPARRAPFVPVVAGSLALGALGAVALVLVAFPGAVEHVTTGVALLALSAGWTLLGALTSALTSAPQRWAYAPGSFLAAAGLVLLTVAPGEDGMRAASWVWPPALLAVLAWSARQARTSMPGRTRWLVYPALGALALSSVAALVEDVWQVRDTRSTTVPGTRYDVGGHRLHLVCRGSGSPTVVLESGLGGSSALWTPVATATAATTRVCAYDRAGVGWSDAVPRPQDGAAVTADLHRLLEVAGESGPYVLAGHSTGGAYAMTYAARYPGQVAGLVLLDAAGPHQFTALPDYPRRYAAMTRLYGVAPTLARLGLGRLPVVSGNEVPGDAGRQARMFAAGPRGARTARDELSTYHRTFAQAQALTSFGDRPLVVVTADDTVADTAGWAAAQRQLALLSRNSSARTVDSSHLGLLDHPGSLEHSVAAVQDVVRAVRAGSAPATP